MTMSKVSIQGIARYVYTHPVESHFMKSFIRSMSARIDSSSKSDVCGYSIYCKCKTYVNSTLCKGLSRYSCVCEF